MAQENDRAVDGNYEPLENRLRSMILGNESTALQGSRASSDAPTKSAASRPRKSQGRQKYEKFSLSEPSHQARPHSLNTDEVTVRPGFSLGRALQTPQQTPSGHSHQIQPNGDSQLSQRKLSQSPRGQQTATYPASQRQHPTIGVPGRNSGSVNQPQMLGRGQQTPPFGQAQRRAYGQNSHGPRSAPNQHALLQAPRRSGYDVIHDQESFLEHQARQTIPHLEMSLDEFNIKDVFRIKLQRLCRTALAAEGMPSESLSLICFGSLASGFGMPGCDMDLALAISVPLPEMPRLLEKSLLNAGIGARLLTRTRVPIIKICEQPSDELYSALVQSREKWDALSSEEREEFDRPARKDEPATESSRDEQQIAMGYKDGQDSNNLSLVAESGQRSNRPSTTVALSHEFDVGHADQDEQTAAQANIANRSDGRNLPRRPPQQRRPQKQWYREKAPGPLDFPKSGAGIQCDINFSNPLGIQNTLLLRCYSHCDVRVRLMILFIKNWASRRKINSSYNGTLSSYGYVLMVLHYLVNVVQPAVCPNLQLARNGLAVRSLPSIPQLKDDYDVSFWHDEDEIKQQASRGLLTHNRESLGALLRGFFFYFAQQGGHVPMRGFAWTQEVLSLRTPGGILTKQVKGWTGAKTTLVDKVR